MRSREETRWSHLIIIALRRKRWCLRSWTRNFAFLSGCTRTFHLGFSVRKLRVHSSGMSGVLFASRFYSKWRWASWQQYGFSWLTVDSDTGCSAMRILVCMHVWKLLFGDIPSLQICDLPSFFWNIFSASYEICSTAQAQSLRCVVGTASHRNYSKTNESQKVEGCQIF